MKVLIEKEKYNHLWIDLHNSIIDIKDKISEDEYNTLMSCANVAAELTDDMEKQNK